MLLRLAIVFACFSGHAVSGECFKSLTAECLLQYLLKFTYTKSTGLPDPLGETKEHLFLEKMTVCPRYRGRILRTSCSASLANISEDDLKPTNP